MVNFYLNGKAISVITNIEKDFFVLHIRRVDSWSDNNHVLGALYKIKESSLDDYKQKISLSDLIFDDDIKQMFADYLYSNSKNDKKNHQHENSWEALEKIRTEMSKIINQY